MTTPELQAMPLEALQDARQDLHSRKQSHALYLAEREDELDTLEFQCAEIRSRILISPQDSHLLEQNGQLTRLRQDLISELQNIRTNAEDFSRALHDIDAEIRIKTKATKQVRTITIQRNAPHLKDEHLTALTTALAAFIAWLHIGENFSYTYLDPDRVILNAIRPLKESGQWPQLIQQAEHRINKQLEEAQ